MKEIFEHSRKVVDCWYEGYKSTLLAKQQIERQKKKRRK